MSTWLVPVLVALISGPLAGGVVALVQAVRGRGRARADTVDVLSDTAREWVTDFKAEALASRAESASARAETHALRVEVGRVRLEAHALADELHRIRLAIFAPDATIDGLRELVRRGGGASANGQP